MHATHADLTEGERTDITIEFVTRRTIDTGDTGDTRVHRLLVDDQHGTRFAVLVAPDTGLLAGLKTGETYHFDGLLASTPATQADAPTDACPNCGRELDVDLDFCHWCTTRLEGVSEEVPADSGFY